MTSRFLVDPSGSSTSTDPALASKVKQCYNNITVNTNNITLENTDSGVSKTVAVSGGSSSSTIAFNSVSVSGNDLVFGMTDGTTDSEPLNALTAITDLEALTINHTTDITALEALTNGLNVSDITTNASDITALEALTNGLNVSDITTNTTDISNIEADNLVKNIALNGFSYDTTISAGNAPKLVIARENGSATNTQELELSDAFITATKDGDNIKLTTISGDETSVGPFSGSGSGTGTTDLEAREQFKSITQHPDLTEAQITADSVTVNGRTYVFDQSSYSSSNYGRCAFKTSGYWETEDDSDHTYTTHDADDVYDYSGTESIGGYDGEWIKVQFPEPIIVTSFEMTRTSNNEPTPHKFRLLCSNDGTTWSNLDVFDESGTLSRFNGDELSLTGSTFTADTDDSQFGEAFSYYVIVVSEINRHPIFGAGPYYFAIKNLKFFSVSKDVAKCIKANDETFNDANITESGGTWYLNLEREGAANDLQLELPTSGTTAGFNPDAVEVVTYGQTSTANSKPYIETTTQGNSTTQVELFDGFVSAVKDGDSIKLTTEAGNDVTVGPFSGGAAASSTTQHPTSALTANYPPIITPAAIGAGGLDGTGGAQGTATASNSLSTSVGPLDAFNNSVTDEDRWQMSTSYGVNEWLKFDVGSGNTKYLGYYRIWARGGPNAADALARAESLPTDWRIEGSNDDVNWNTLDTRSGVNNADIAHQSSATGTLTNYPHKEYQIQNPGAYRYYRLWVVSTASSGGVIISELAYYEIDSQIPRAVGSSEYINSPAYHAFDEDAITEWISQSNRYDVTTGNYLGGFSGTPPSAIALGGYWATGGSFAKPRYYAKNTSDETTTFVRYVLTDPNGQVGANYGIAFYVDTNNDLILDAEWSVGGTATPFNLKVNGGAAVTSSVVQAGDAIELLGTGTSVEATLTVPSELAFGSKLASTTDAGEYLKIDLGVAVEATTLNLKSLAASSEIEEFKLYGSVNNSNWAEIHAQTSANITSNGNEFQITNPNSYQHYGLVITKNTGFHNVSLAEMKLGMQATVDLSNYYNKTELNPLICKARGSVQYTGGSSGTVTLLNEVNINPTVSIPNSLFNLNNYRNYSTTSYHSWVIFDFTFATPLTSLEYQVALNDADQNNNAVAVGNIMSLAVKDKSLNGFQVAVVYYEPSATSAQNFGFDFVVF